MKEIIVAMMWLTVFTGPTLQEMLKSCDDLFHRFENKAAYELLLNANRDSPHSAEVLWRLSRVEMHIADHMPSSTDQQKDAQLEEYQTAYNYADSAIAADPRNSMAYTFRASANGKIALFKGIFSVAPIVKRVRDDCEHAIALDSSNAIACYIMGRTHAKLAEKPKLFRWPLGLAWGNIDDGIRFYQRAVVLDSTFVMFRFDLAKALINENEYQKAREQLLLIATLPSRDENDDSLKAEAAKLLEEIKTK